MSKRNSNGQRGNGEAKNKSEAVRQMLKENPKAPVRELVADLAKKGVRVQPSLVYFIRGKQRHLDLKQRRKNAADSAKLAGIANPVELVLKAKVLAREAGGIHNLKQLIDALAE